MSSIYEIAVEQVSQGARFSVNFQTRNLKVNGKHVIKNGSYEGELGVSQSPDVLGDIIKLFERYRHSIPSERSDKKRKAYFIALPEHELSDDDMLYGEPREIAQLKLELYVLAVIMNGTLVWDDFAKGKWFWRSPEQPGLILLKEWFNPVNK